MNKTPSVYIIILNYNSYLDTVECLESIKKIKYNNYKIVIVNNASTDDSDEKLRLLFTKDKDIHIIQNPTNLGFAGGNNVGIEYALKNKAKYVCLINSDVCVESDFLEKLVCKMEEEFSLAITGPIIYEYYDKSIIQSAGQEINFLTGQISVIGAQKEYLSIADKKNKCDYLCGACLLVRATVIEKIGMLPEVYFLYYEETEWCLKTKKAGYKIKCVFDSKVYHKGSSTVKKFNGLCEYFQNRNRVLFIKRNSKVFPFIIFCIYLSLQTFYRIIFKHYSVYIILNYLDGFCGRINHRYSNCYINNKSI